ncbi:aklavinone 12-hydroxylase RdmE [Kibdelosporangium persicum]|uniref:Tetracenomycin polyketide synthesis hydroxylase tcmG n=1 Tax=Kibdelosporangium persicum TaxID=2698649 RepID=A0ABX2FFS5_9PSEU|nr:FAD-dependent oxidoreductase [Kibdelosporangium persicum]NRN70241.1 Tetracenomycin polyketide synthesis hydroxylase tcmG [Kibdelosporangium persicum]
MTDVIVVGAGLGGTSTAMFLAMRGVDVLLVERHQGTSPHPRAAGQHPRTMEFLRIGQVADEILAAGHPPSAFRIKVAESLRGKVIHTIVEDFDDVLSHVEQVSPAGWGSATQDQVEPILLNQATKHGATVRFATELVSFEQDADGVTANLLDIASGRAEQVRAKYLVAADGNRSPVRERLGIPRSGFGGLSNHIGIVFDADMSELLPDGEQWLYYLQNPAFTGAYINVNRQDRHIFAIEYHPEKGESFADYPHSRIIELMRIGLDAPDLQPEILWTGPWEMAARIADRWRDGRVFLVGDAAKVTPPTGGLGGNAAVCDGFDLAWKLAAVLTGEAGPGLLDTYEPERKSAAEMVVNESLFNYVQRMAPHLAGPDIPTPVGPIQAVLGVRHTSSAVIPEPNDGSPTMDPFRISGEPGFRAPHVVLPTGESTLDVWGAGWALLAGPDGGWDKVDAGIQYRSLGDQYDRFGVGPEGASLIRPDGIVAWRTTDKADEVTLKNVLRQVLSC